MGCGASSKKYETKDGAADAPKDNKDAKLITEDTGHAKLIIDNTGSIDEFYNVGRTLGLSMCGDVRRCVNKSTGANRAVKTLDKQRSGDKRDETNHIRHRIAIMKKMDHPNIVKLYETFEDHRKIYLIMEMCSGGELFDEVVFGGGLTEKQAAIVMQQIFRGIFHMHALKLTHRDLKPEKIMFQDKDEQSPVKIVGFGKSCKCPDGHVLTTKMATSIQYVAPEVLAGKYDQSADLWSCGVIMYVLLCGSPPFYGETDKFSDTAAKIRKASFKFNGHPWKNVSKDAKNLINMLLKLNPRERYTAEQSLNHDWIKNKAPKALEMCLSASLVSNLKNFRYTNTFKKAALHVIAGQLEDSKINDLKQLFTRLDSNGNGMLTTQEMREGLMEAGLKEIDSDLQQIIADVDLDGSGVIDYTEFLAAALDQKAHIQEDACWSAFRVFDRSGDGKIQMAELEQVLASGNVEEAMGADAVEKLMKDVDTNGDGEIDFEEFMAMMRKPTNDDQGMTESAVEKPTNDDQGVTKVEETKEVMNENLVGA